MRYDAEYEVEVFDRVEVTFPEPFYLDGRRIPLVRDGIVTALHPVKNQVSVKHDTCKTYRSSGKPIFKTARFPIADVNLIVRDG